MSFCDTASASAGKKIRDVQPPRRFAGHDRRPRSRADRRRAVGAREAHPLARQPVEIRRRLVLAPVAREIVHPEVVAEDEDDIRLRLLGEQRHGEAEQEEECAGKHGGAMFTVAPKIQFQSSRFQCDVCRHALDDQLLMLDVLPYPHWS